MEYNFIWTNPLIVKYEFECVYKGKLIKPIVYGYLSEIFFNFYCQYPGAKIVDFKKIKE